MSTARNWNSGQFPQSGGLKWNSRQDCDDDGGGGNSDGYMLEEKLETMSLSKDQSKPSLSSCELEGSDTSGEDMADRTLSDGRGLASQHSHAYQASISSDEGLQGFGCSKRTLKPSRLRKPSIQGAKERQVLMGSIDLASPDWPAGFESSGVSSTWSAPGELNRYSASLGHCSESDSNSSSGGASNSHKPMNPSFPSPDFEMSRRMNEIREQKLLSRFQGSGRMQRSIGSNHNSDRSSMISSQMLQTPHCCLHCRSDACAAFSSLPPVICCDNGTCRSCSHCCCYPSAAQGRHCHSDTSQPSASSHHRIPSKDSKIDAGSPTRKRIISHLFGGACYVMCYRCFKLLQIPGSFQFINVKCSKLKCGNCSEVIAFSLVDKGRIVPSDKSNFFSYGEDTSARPLYGGDVATDQSDEQSICNEDYGSTEYETDTTEERKKKKKKQKALHRLMGYFSARDVLL